MDIRSGPTRQETNNTSKMLPSPRFINFIAPRRTARRAGRAPRRRVCAGVLCVAGDLNYLNADRDSDFGRVRYPRVDNCQSFGGAVILWRGRRVHNAREVTAHTLAAATSRELENKPLKRNGLKSRAGSTGRVCGSNGDLGRRVSG